MSQSRSRRHTDRPSRFAHAAALVVATVATAMVWALASTPAAPAAPAARDLPCVTQAAIERVRSAPRPAFRRLYRRCRGQLRTALGPELSDVGPDALRFVLASLVARRIAPYGASYVYGLRPLLRASTLDCAGYAALAWHLARLAGGAVRHAAIVGWDGGTLGNHAQVAYRRADDELVVDPTVGLVVRATYAELVAGIPVATERIVAFPAGDEDVTAHLRDVVVDAAAHGLERPESVLYVQDHPPGQHVPFARAADRD